ncbi:hypothetical protein AV530_001748 [Patagioenas fasciata monilis]|uniref:Uncharacterized protein n=1 Tax=Patagioenas fasciata monilis TaxID=372326 RepID=A0A1V4KMB3_PATFA|nr:hypothetical protein AV530_001748 [Patagioenas fasciata monilis]
MPSTERKGPARPPVGSGQRLVCGNRGRRFLLAGASGAASGALEGSGGGEDRIFFKFFKYSCTTRKKKKHSSE